MKRLKKRKIVTRLKKLARKKHWTEGNTKKLIRLDKEITQAMIRAEKQVIPMHMALCTPQIHKAYSKV